MHGFWGVTCSLTFWGAMIRATRSWAPGGEQGRAFGILESGRGIAEVVSSTALLAVFARLGSGKAGLSRVIFLFSIIDILLGLMAWFTLVDTAEEKQKMEEDRPKIGFAQILRVLKMPAVWLMSVVILAAYSAYWGSYYFTPYATDVFLMSVVFALTPGNPKLVMILIANTALASLAIFALRGIYFALLEEGGIPPLRSSGDTVDAGLSARNLAIQKVKKR